MKKMYLLTLTLLLMLCGQASYSFSLDEGGGYDDEYGRLFINFYEDLYGFSISSLTIDQNGIAYYAGAVWDKAGEITNSKKQIDYTNDFIELKKNKALVKIE